MKNITIIGIGNIGLGLALLIEKSGINVLGVDINTNYVEKLNSKTFFSYEPLYNEYLKNSSNLKITTSLEEGINHSNIIFIMIQTLIQAEINFMTTLFYPIYYLILIN